MPVLAIEQPNVTVDADGTEVSSVLRLAGEDISVRFRVSSTPVFTGVEPFLAVSLLPAAKLGLPLETRAECSPLFLQGLESILEKFCRWDTSLSKIPVRAPAARVAEPTGLRRTGSFFSGGVDSFDTLFHHRDQISDLVFVHGFDIPCDKELFYRQTADLYEDAARTLGKRLVRVWTNVRQFSDRFVNWGVFEHGPALGAVALLLGLQLERVLIPGEYFPPDSVPPPRGSHPDTDPLWSTEHLAVVHDGHDRTRPHKIGQIYCHEVVQRLLRVCWASQGETYNCCACSKCLRNMAILRAYGVLDRFTSFPRKLDLKRLSRLPLDRGEWRDMLAETLQILGRSSGDPKLEKAIRHCLSASRGRRAGTFLRRSIDRLRGVCGSRNSL